MNQLRSIASILLFVLAMWFLIISSNIVDYSRFTSIERWIAGLCIFGAVVALHWSSWAIAVPNGRLFGRDVRCWIQIPKERNFFTAIYAFGYLLSAMFCLRVAGTIPGEVRWSSIVLGMTLIFVGLLVRFREVAACSKL